MLGLLTLALALRLLTVFREGLWLSEAYSLHLALHSPLQTIAESSLDGRMPLYYLLLNVWLRVFGDSVLAARLMSVAISLLAIWVAMALAGRIVPRTGALTTGLFLALSPFFVYYSQEIGPHALLGLCALWATWGVCRLCSPELGFTGRLGPVAAFVLASAVGVYTHAAFGLIVLSLLGLGLWKCRSHARPLLWGTLVAALLALPWLPALLSRPFLADGQGSASALSGLMMALLIWMAGPGQIRLPLLAPSSAGAGLVVFTVLVLLIMLVIMTCTLWRECRGPVPRSFPTTVLLVIVIAPPLLLLLLSFWRPVFQTALLLPSGLAFLVLLAIILTQLPPARMVTAIGLVSLLFAVSLTAYTLSPDYGRGQTMQQLAQYFDQNVRPTDLVVFQDETLYLPARVYLHMQGTGLPSENYLYWPPRLAPRSPVWPPVTADLDPLDLLRRVQAAGRVVVVRREGEELMTPLTGQPLQSTTIAGAAQNPDIAVNIYDAALFLPMIRQMRPAEGATQAPQEATRVY